MTQSWHQKQDWCRPLSYSILKLSGCRQRGCWKQLITDDESAVLTIMEHDTKYKRLKDLSTEEYILPGTTVCGGCGGLEALRLFHKALGRNVIFVNAAGCFTLLALFPFSPFRGPWLYTPMASGP